MLKILPAKLLLVRKLSKSISVTGSGKKRHQLCSIQFDGNSAIGAERHEIKTRFVTRAPGHYGISFPDPGLDVAPDMFAHFRRIVAHIYSRSDFEQPDR